VIAQHLHAQLEPPSRLNPAIDPGLEAVILRLLARDPDDRYRSAGEALAALRHPVLPAALEARLLNVPHNLPAEMTSFVGREQDIEQVKGLLANNRLVTLTGSGGTGKSRLAIHTAVELLAEHPDGVWLVELAPLDDPALLVRSVAALLGVPERPGIALVVSLQEQLRASSCLLILDNCEHLVAACAQFAEGMLRSTQKLRILATSQEALGIGGEAVLPLQPLALPQDRLGAPNVQLLEYPAIRLFVERAEAVSAAFQLTATNGTYVAQICRRLDGLPLAIELAAVRVKLLSVEQIAERLDDRFRLLTGGSRTAPHRQQTLRAAIEWSYSLLGEAEQALFRRLAVFAGGWELEAVEAVGVLPGFEFEALEQLSQLVDKSRRGSATICSKRSANTGGRSSWKAENLPPLPNATPAIFWVCWPRAETRIHGL
jgi:predicted ATPase